MNHSSRKSHRAVLWAVLLLCMSSDAPCRAAVLDGYAPAHPRIEPVIDDNGDGPPSISIPLYSSNPGGSGSSGVEGTSVTPEPSSLLLISIAAGALAMLRRSRDPRAY
jgi:hypothetical protein